MAKTKPAVKPAKVIAPKPTTTPLPGKSKFVWQPGDVVVHKNGKLPPGSKPIKAPKTHTPAKPKA